MSNIVDFSFGRPGAQALVDAGIKGIVRYLAPATNAGKFITAAELAPYRAAGLGVAFVWEWYANRAAEGRDAGVQDAQAALAQANALGVPASVPLYFAVDWDISDYAPNSDDGRAKLGPVADYFDGVASVLGHDRTGLYGGFYAVKRYFDAGIGKFGWQTYAWSGGQWDSRAQLRQVKNGQTINGAGVDYNDATTDNWGQWSSDVAPNPSPAPAPQPSGDTHKYTIQKGDTFWALEAANNWTHGTLQNLNPGVDPTKLAIGQQINVPGSGSSPAPAPTPVTGHHTIVAGDTFWGLEAANGWAHGTLQGLNPGVNANALQIGQVINVPAGNTPQPAHPTTGTYVIKSGDTFWALETAHGWAHGTLQSLNPGVNPATLQIGSTIVIPA